jgi:prepilin signal peptidase PulO-like enzyme (type II secretory pathway)
MQAILMFAILMAVQLMIDSLGPHSREFRLWNATAYSAAATVFGIGCVAMAVFAAGAFNSALVVRATVAWAAAVTVLLFVINVLASALVDKTADALGISDRLLAAVLGTLAGLALNPLASRLREWAQRRGATA